MRSKNDKKRSIWLIVGLFAVLGLVSLSVFQFVFAEGRSTTNCCEGTEISMFRTQAALVPSADVGARNQVQKKLKPGRHISLCVRPSHLRP